MILVTEDCLLVPEHACAPGLCCQLKGSPEARKNCGSPAVLQVTRRRVPAFFLERKLSTAT